MYAEDPPAFFLPAATHATACTSGCEKEPTSSRSPARTSCRVRRASPRSETCTPGAIVAGAGLALELASAVTAELVATGITTIVLNIVATNTPARRVYERIGFRDYCEFYEGAAVR